MAYIEVFVPTFVVPQSAEKELVTFCDVDISFEKPVQDCSIPSLHQDATYPFRELFGVAVPAHVKKVLEISYKSNTDLGSQASASELMVQLPNMPRSSVESLYRKSMVFGAGGPGREIYEKKLIDVKRSIRLADRGKLIGFQCLDEHWGLEDGFYSWLYLCGLMKNRKIAEALMEYEAFTDITFNPHQANHSAAHSAALYVAAMKLDIIESHGIIRPKVFKEFFTSQKIAILRDRRPPTIFRPWRPDRSVTREEIATRLIKERGIEKLIHFTDRKNIPSIREHGILSVERLDKDNVKYSRNDDLRLDNQKFAISVSVSKRNEPLFHVFDKEEQNSMVELEIDPQVIVDKACWFYCTNAANKRFGRQRDQYQLRSAFDGMFADMVEIKNCVFVRRVGQRDHEPTDVQAEIMVKDQVERKYIVGWPDVTKDNPT